MFQRAGRVSLIRNTKFLVLNIIALAEQAGFITAETRGQAGMTQVSLGEKAVFKRHPANTAVPHLLSYFSMSINPPVLFCFFPLPLLNTQRNVMRPICLQNITHIFKVQFAQLIWRANRTWK